MTQSLKCLAPGPGKLQQLRAGIAAAPQTSYEVPPQALASRDASGGGGQTSDMSSQGSQSLCPKRKNQARKSRCIPLLKAIAKYCSVPGRRGKKQTPSLDGGGGEGAVVARLWKSLQHWKYRCCHSDTIYQSIIKLITFCLNKFSFFNLQPICLNNGKSSEFYHK